MLGEIKQVEDIITSIQSTNSALTGGFIEKLAGQADAIIDRVAPLVLPKLPGLSLNSIKAKVMSIVPKEGVTFDNLLDLIEKAADPANLSEFISPSKGGGENLVKQGLDSLIVGGTNED